LWVNGNENISIYQHGFVIYIYICLIMKIYSYIYSMYSLFKKDEVLRMNDRVIIIVYIRPECQ